MRMRTVLCLSALLMFLTSLVVQAGTFNGAGDNQTDANGYYYTVGGGLFPNGQTRNGDNASGGTMRFLTDDPAWGQSIDVWHKDDWYPVTSSMALTIKNGASVAFDNNGIETGNVPAGYWNGSSVPFSQTSGYSMSNNFDWIYAGLFQLDQSVKITKLIGYFLVPQAPFVSSINNFAGNFDPNNPALRYHMNIFSEVSGQLPANTGSFAGDVFSSDRTSGTFSWSNTGYVRQTSWTADIYRLEYTLDTPMDLPAGNYYFSHDASVVPVPSSLKFGLGSLVLLAIVNSVRRQPKLKSQVA